MTSRDFCYWLQGFFEIMGTDLGDDATPSLTYKQSKLIQQHLNLVFKHEIDPSIDGGDPQKRLELQAIHDGVTREELEKLLTEAIQKHEEEKPHHTRVQIRDLSDMKIKC